MTSPPAAAQRIPWRTVTVAALTNETSTTRTLVLDVPGWPGHVPGQHVDVRLTADDGYQAARSYSIASPPEENRLALTIQRLADGELSTHLCGETRVGDRFEVRGPIGGYFVWDARMRGPLLLVAGGSGIVPLMSMLRHRDRSPRQGPARLLYSSRGWSDVIYREELTAMSAGDPSLEVFHAITRDAPAEWEGYRRRIDREILAEVAWPAAQKPGIYVCGPTALVEGVASTLVEMGYDPASVKTERFGPTGS